MTVLTRNFDPLTPLVPKFQKFAIQILLFHLKHTIAVVTHAHYSFFTPLGYRVLLAKNNVSDQNWRGAGLGEHPQIWDPLHISATVKASTFKFGIRIGFGTSLKNDVLDQNWRGSGLGEHQRNWTPYLSFKLLKLAISNLTQKLDLGLAYQKRRFGPKLAGVWASGASNKNLVPLTVSATV